MELKIITENENPLFNRKEIEGEVYAEVTPSRSQVASLISEKFSANPETIKIRTIRGKFGQRVFLVVANIYKSKEDKEKIENKKKKDLDLEKKQAEPEQPAESAPAETPAEQPQEKPTEEKTEAQKEEKSEPSGEAN